jgi:hypothetical protein
MAYTEQNKISKIYNQRTDIRNQITFQDVQQAKDFFLTQQAKDTYNKYCHRQEWKLVNDNKSLHWTVSFKLYHEVDANYVPDSSLWRDTKEKITGVDGWFVRPNWPIIDHDAEHLF